MNAIIATLETTALPTLPPVPCPDSKTVKKGRNPLNAKPRRPCTHAGCTNTTTTQLCRSHSKPYTECAFPGCTKKCRGELCRIHDPVFRAKHIEYMQAYNRAKKGGNIDSVLMSRLGPLAIVRHVKKNDP